MSHSPTLFSSDDEAASPCREKNLRKKLQTLLQGVPPPSSITVSKFTAEEILFKYKENEINFNCCNINADDSVSSQRKVTLNIPLLNKSDVSEDIASLSQKVQERYVQLETMSSCNIWFQSSVPLSGSAKKRSRAKQRIGFSPGRRLSHLARRKQIFSCANLRQMAEGDKKRHIEIKKNGIYQDKGTDKSVYHEKLNMSKRALFLSPEDESNLSKHVREFPKRKLFGSSEKKKKIPLKENSKRSEVKRWLFQQGFNNTQVSRKRLRDENFDQAPERKSKCPRRSLTFQDEDESSRSPGTSSTHSSLSLPPLSQNHKNKLLWAVSVALKEANITRKNSDFKKCASSLFMTCRKNLNKILSSQMESTSEKMLHFARQSIPSLLDKLGMKPNRNALTPVKQNHEENVSENCNKIAEGGKENLDESCQSDSNVVFKTPIKFIRVKKKSKTCDNKIRLKGVLIRCKSLESLDNVGEKTPDKKIVKKLFGCDMNNSSFAHDESISNFEVTLLNDSDVNLASQTLAPSSVTEEPEGFSLLDALKKPEGKTGGEVIADSDDADSVVDSDGSQEIVDQEFKANVDKFEGPTRIEESEEEEDLFEEDEKIRDEATQGEVTFSLVYEGKEENESEVEKTDKEYSGRKEDGEKVCVNLDELRREIILSRENGNSEGDEVITSDDEEVLDKMKSLDAGKEADLAAGEVVAQSDEEVESVTCDVEEEPEKVISLNAAKEADVVKNEIVVESDEDVKPEPVISSKEAATEMQEECDKAAERDKEVKSEFSSNEGDKGSAEDIADQELGTDREGADVESEVQESEENWKMDGEESEDDIPLVNFKNKHVMRIDEEDSDDDIALINFKNKPVMSFNATREAEATESFPSENTAELVAEGTGPLMNLGEVHERSTEINEQDAKPEENETNNIAAEPEECQNLKFEAEEAVVEDNEAKVKVAEHKDDEKHDNVIKVEIAADESTNGKETSVQNSKPEDALFAVPEPYVSSEDDSPEPDESVICDDSMLPSQTSTPILSSGAKTKGRKLRVKKSKKNWKIVAEESDDDVPLSNLKNLKLKVRLSHEWEVVSKNYSNSDLENSTNCSARRTQDNTEEPSTQNTVEESESSADYSDIKLKQFLEEKNFVEIEPGHTTEEQSALISDDSAEVENVSEPEVAAEENLPVEDDVADDPSQEKLTSFIEIKPEPFIDEPKIAEDEKLEDIKSPLMKEVERPPEEVQNFEEVEFNQIKVEKNIPEGSENFAEIESEPFVKEEEKSPEKLRQEIQSSENETPFTDIELEKESDRQKGNVSQACGSGFTDNCSTVDHSALKEMIRFHEPIREEGREENIYVTPGKRPASPILYSSQKRRVLSLENYKARKQLEKHTIPDDLDGILPLKSDESGESPEKKIWNIRLKHPHDRHKRVHKRRREKHSHNRHPPKSDVAEVRQDETTENTVEVIEEESAENNVADIEEKPTEDNVAVVEETPRIQIMYDALVAVTIILERQVKCAAENPTPAIKEDIRKNLKHIEVINQAISHELEEWAKKPENAERAKKWCEVISTFYVNNPILKPESEQKEVGEMCAERANLGKCEKQSPPKPVEKECVGKHKDVESVMNGRSVDNRILQTQASRVNEIAREQTSKPVQREVMKPREVHGMTSPLELVRGHTGFQAQQPETSRCVQTVTREHVMEQTPPKIARVQPQNMVYQQSPDQSHHKPVFQTQVQKPVENMPVMEQVPTIEIPHVYQSHVRRSMLEQESPKGTLHVHQPSKPRHVQRVAPMMEQTPPRKAPQVQPPQVSKYAERSFMEETPPKEVLRVQPANVLHQPIVDQTPPRQILQIHQPQILSPNSLYRPYESVSYESPPPKPQILVAPVPQAPVIVHQLQYAHNVSYQNEQTPPKQILHVPQPPPLMSQPLKSPYSCNSSSLHKQAVERWHEQNALSHQPASRRPLLQGNPGFANYNYPQKSLQNVSPSYANSPPASSYIHSPPLHSYANSPPLHSYTNSSPLHSYTNSPPAPNYANTPPPLSSYANSPPVHPPQKILSGSPGFSNFNHPQRYNGQESSREIHRSAHYTEYLSPDRSHFNNYHNQPTYHSPDNYAYGREATPSSSSSSAFHSISSNGHYNSYSPWNSPTVVNNSSYHQQSPVVKPLRRSLVPQIHDAPYYGNC